MVRTYLANAEETTAYLRDNPDVIYLGVNLRMVNPSGYEITAIEGKAPRVVYYGRKAVLVVTPDQSPPGCPYDQEIVTEPAHSFSGRSAR